MISSAHKFCRQALPQIPLSLKQNMCLKYNSRKMFVYSTNKTGVLTMSLF
jgi:hypothetical protein